MANVKSAHPKECADLFCQSSPMSLVMVGTLIPSVLLKYEMLDSSWLMHRRSICLLICALLPEVSLRKLLVIVVVLFLCKNTN